MTPPTGKIEVEWSAGFRNQMTKLRRIADSKPQSAHAMVLDGLQRLSDQVLTVWDHCFGQDTLLHGDLKGIRRYKFGKRGRLFYIANQQTSYAVILYFGDNRKAGDANDPYKVIAAKLRSTELDLCFLRAGLSKPDLS